jgi:P27 family predicted phage terminase small subunit
MNIGPKPPKNLSKKSKKLWKELQGEYQITDAAGLDLLTDYCEFYDRRQRAREIIQDDGITVLDRFKQVQAHPACRVERDSSAAMTRILKQLNLDIEPLKTVGRPPGR